MRVSEGLMDIRLQNLLEAMLQDGTWREPNQLSRRIELEEQLERGLFHGGDSLMPSLRERAVALMAALETSNRKFYDSLRADIRRGEGAASLLRWAAALRGCDEEKTYGPLDALVSGLLDLAEPGQVPTPAAEMVFYQPTPARHIFDFIARAAIGDQDTVFDLGAGLGHVTLLTAICTRARCVGIELQGAYVASATRCAHMLQLPNASFIEQDVRHACLSTGTVFYLYTPFTGGVLRTVLDMLRREAGHRAIRLCTLGPCTDVVAGESWLSPEDACDRERVTVFSSIA